MANPSASRMLTRPARARRAYPESGRGRDGGLRSYDRRFLLVYSESEEEIVRDLASFWTWPFSIVAGGIFCEYRVCGGTRRTYMLGTVNGGVRKAP